MINDAELIFSFQDLDLYDDSRILIHSGPLARQKSGTQDSWSQVFGALLDNYCAQLLLHSCYMTDIH